MRESEFLFRAAVNPLRFAVHASRKPRVAVSGHPLSLHREESRWFAYPGKPRSAHAPSPVFRAPALELRFLVSQSTGTAIGAT
jgi:hypothetical protein